MITDVTETTGWTQVHAMTVAAIRASSGVILTDEELETVATAVLRVQSLACGMLLDAAADYRRRADEAEAALAKRRRWWPWRA